MINYIFDVDGTLTPSRQRIDHKFGAWFEDFCSHNNVYLVTGSDREKTLEQVGSNVYNLAKRVYNCSGNDVWIGMLNVKTSDYKIPETAIAFLRQCLDESQWHVRTGNHIEARPGMINFSILGRNASLGERRGYVYHDKKHSERKTIADAFNIMFPDLHATIGGETGLDIGPIGFNKSKILEDFSDSDEIYFFGDATFKGGNDYEIYTEVKKNNGTSFTVQRWEETWKILRELKE